MRQVLRGKQKVNCAWALERLMLGPAKDIPPSEPAIAFLAAVHEAPWLASGAVVSLGMRTNLCP